MTLDVFHFTSFIKFNQPLFSILVLFETDGAHEIGSLAAQRWSCLGKDLLQSKSQDPNCVEIPFSSFALL